MSPNNCRLKLYRGKNLAIIFGVLTSLSAVTKDVSLHPLLSSKFLLNLQPDPKTLCSTHFQVFHSRRNQRSWFFTIWHVCSFIQYITFHPIEKQSLKKFPLHCHFCQSCSIFAASQEKDWDKLVWRNLDWHKVSKLPEALAPTRRLRGERIPRNSGPADARPERNSAFPSPALSSCLVRNT